jgi:hypothetical protein
MTEFAINRLMANLRTQLPGALDNTLKLEIFNTVATFFHDSNVWQETQSFNTKPDKQNYEVTADNADAFYTQLLDLRTYDPEDPNFERTTSITVPAWLIGPTELHLYNRPLDVQRLRATFAVAPRATDRMDQFPAIPDAYWDKYHDVFMEGALARMMAQVAKPYSNERMGIFHGRRFKAATSMAKNDFYNGDMRGGQHWRFPQSFRTRNF